MKAKALFLLTAALSVMQPSMAMQSGQVVTQNADCPICLEDFGPNQQIFNFPNCIHRIHRICNRDLMDCPFCRRVVISREELVTRMKESVMLIGLADGAEDDFARALRCQEDAALLSDTSGIITRGRISPTLLLNAINDPNSPLNDNIQEVIVRLNDEDLIFGSRAALRNENINMLFMICNELHYRGVSLDALIKAATNYSQLAIVRALREINERS
jgi:hypothetical protein